MTPYTCVVDCNEKMPGFDPSEESDNICFGRLLFKIVMMFLSWNDGGGCTALQMQS